MFYLLLHSAAVVDLFLWLSQEESIKEIYARKALLLHKNLRKLRHLFN